MDPPWSPARSRCEVVVRTGYGDPVVNGPMGKPFLSCEINVLISLVGTPPLNDRESDPWDRAKPRCGDRQLVRGEPDPQILP